MNSLETSLKLFPDGEDVVLGNFTIHTPGTSEKILSMEAFEPLLASIECTSTGLKLGFVSDEAFAYAQKVWDWVGWLFPSSSSSVKSNAHDQLEFLSMSLVKRSLTDTVPLAGQWSG